MGSKPSNTGEESTSHGHEAFVSAPAEGEGKLQVPHMMQGLSVALILGVFYVGLYRLQPFDAVDNATGFLFV
jgi:hypothetical protein